VNFKQLPNIWDVYVSHETTVYTKVEITLEGEHWVLRAYLGSRSCVAAIEPTLSGCMDTAQRLSF